MCSSDLVRADVFLTGDIKYHQALEAAHNNLNLIDIGHFESERYFGKSLAKYLQNLAIPTIISNSKNPFSYVRTCSHNSHEVISSSIGILYPVQDFLCSVVVAIEDIGHGSIVALGLTESRYSLGIIAFLQIEQTKSFAQFGHIGSRAEILLSLLYITLVKNQ